MNDRWNVRIWLRDWLNKPSKARLAERRTAETAAARTLVAQGDNRSRRCRYGFELDSSARITGLRGPEQHGEPMC